MLTFEQKLAIIETFPELDRRQVSLGRINFHYEQSVHEKKTVVYHLHPNGNGFVYAGLLPDVETDDRGMVNIREYEADDLRELIRASIQSLSLQTDENAGGEPAAAEADTEEEQQPVQEEQWVNTEHAQLRLVLEEEMWYVYAGLNLDSAFDTYEEAVDYLREEGFSRK
ncbi:hypothetical protein [Paenibacillus sp. y28]|uniref:hypothetical protein n=1 Tax=Paenibacillus sp. y28 TaxID=3129110 RepID=UPI003015CBE8